MQIILMNVWIGLKVFRYNSLMQTELAIGVDIGGTLVRIGVVNKKGKLLKK